MSPADSLSCPPRLMSSSVKLGSTHITGPPRFLGSSLSARRPQPPRQAQWLLLVSFTTSSRFHHLCKADHLQLSRNEAESGSLSLRLTPSSQGASTVRLPFLPPLQLHVEQVTHMTGSFHPVRSTRFILAHQRTRRTLSSFGVRCSIPGKLVTWFSRSIACGQAWSIVSRQLSKNRK